MRTITAKVFCAGNSQALRLPRALNVKAESLQVTPTASGFVATDPAAVARRLKALRALWGSCPDFPNVRRELSARSQPNAQPIGPYDVQLAGHPLALRAISVTDNTREFAHVPGLTVEDWMA